MPAKYTIVRSIKRGGMAEVFEGRVHGDGAFARRVAIKRLLHYDNHAELSGFADEARIVAQLDHPNIVSVFDYGAVDGQPFQVLEMVDGLDLRELEELARQRGCPIPTEVALVIVAEVARALDYAHRAVDERGRPLGIVHRDVTPHNILVSWAGHVKLADFGIAMATDRRAVTEPGVVKGKLSFMAPEYLLSGAVTVQADVFALGCVLHFALTGVSPYGSDDARRGAARGIAPPLSSSIPDDIARIIAWACHPTPARRCPSAINLAVATERALNRRVGGPVAQIVLDWLGDLRSRSTPAPAERLAQLFELEPTGHEAEGGLVRFQSVPARGDRDPREALAPTDLSDVAEPNARVASGANPALPTSPDETSDAGLDFMCTEIEGASLDTLSALADPKGPAPAANAIAPDDKLARHAVLANLQAAGRGQLLLARPRAQQPGRPNVLMLKIWPPETSNDLTFVALVSREATLRRQLPDDHLPAVYDLGVDDGRLYVELEYAVGRTLRQLIDRLRRPIEPEDVAAVGAGMARGLSAARRIREALGSDFARVPCDLTADRVFVTVDGQVVITDFAGKSTAERMLDEDWSRSTDEVARRRELWTLVSTLQSMLADSSERRATVLRTRIAEILEGTGPERVARELAAALDGFSHEPVLRLKALLNDAFGDAVSQEQRALRRMLGEVDDDAAPVPEMDPEPEPTVVGGDRARGPRTHAPPRQRAPVAHFASRPPPTAVDPAEAADATVVPKFVTEPSEHRGPTVTPAAPDRSRWFWVAAVALGSCGAALALSTCVRSTPAPKERPRVIRPIKTEPKAEPRRADGPKANDRDDRR